MTGDGKLDRFSVAALDECVKYLKIETAADGITGYSVGGIAMPLLA